MSYLPPRQRSVTSIAGACKSHERPCGRVSPRDREETWGMAIWNVINQTLGLKMPSHTHTEFHGFRGTTCFPFQNTRYLIQAIAHRTVGEGNPRATYATRENYAVSSVVAHQHTTLPRPATKFTKNNNTAMAYTSNTTTQSKHPR